MAMGDMSSPGWALRTAAGRGDSVMVGALLAEGARAKAKGGEELRDALMIAASVGALDCVVALLPYSDPLAVDAFGLSALMLAAQSCPRCVEVLLPVSDARAISVIGMSAFVCAAFAGNAQCLEILAPSSDVELRDHRGRGAAMWTAHRGDAKLMAKVARYCDVLALEPDGRSAKEVAAKHGHGECVEFLEALESRRELETSVSYTSYSPLGPKRV
jgi:ankyrin repeat protein